MPFQLTAITLHCLLPCNFILIAFYFSTAAGHIWIINSFDEVILQRITSLPLATYRIFDLYKAKPQDN